ncbi:hypothetical protein LTR86_009181 [Recurvomyces mirabilis]|nr:hypothetical protein LTR86_009181 [Recurvomyces mirabilis]
MRLRIVPFSDVRSAITSSTAYDPQSQFNTHEHSISEITAAVPNVDHRARSEREQPWLRLRSWLDLILESQRIDPGKAHQIKLPGWYCDDLVRAGATWEMSRRISADVWEDMRDGFPERTASGHAVDALFTSTDHVPMRYFVRLDACSLKDAEILPSGKDTDADRPMGNVALTSASELWQRILTSVRGCRGIKEARNSEEDVYIYLLPWREDVVRGIEFRVFCPPHEGRIAAISQYVWHKPLHAFTSHSSGLETWCDQVLKGIEDVHERISNSEACTSAMRDVGYSFDVLVFGGEAAKNASYQSPGDKHPLVHRSMDVQLIELNSFGATTGCGSCLFHWIRDAEVLYGKLEDVEFRVTLVRDIHSTIGNT